MSALGTRDQILREAEFLIRTRGYSAFSYADLADRVAITKASVHYYFASKEDLVLILVQEYLVRFVAALESIKRQHSNPGERLRAYAHLFLEGFEKGMLPLCGALSAERSALPEPMRPRVQEFFQLHLDWLKEVLEEGLAAGLLRAVASPSQMALVLLSTLEGGSFVGWAFQKKALVLTSFEVALENLEGPAQRKSRSKPRVN